MGNIIADTICRTAELGLTITYTHDCADYTRMGGWSIFGELLSGSGIGRTYVA